MTIQDEQNDENLIASANVTTDGSMESIEEQKIRIAGIWSEWNETKKIPELMGFFDRKVSYISSESPKSILDKHNYPSRNNISDLEFDKWKVELNSKFVKDGYMYLLRGDHPNQEKKGFYSRPYGYAKKTTKEISKGLHSSKEVGYFLYGNDAYLKTAEPSSENIVDELAYKQSQIGGSSFISTTTSIPTAVAGTGNSPERAEQENYEIYVIKLPVEYVINSNTGNHFGMNEDEYLVPDCIYPEEIVTKFSREQAESVYDYFQRELGVTREDMRLSLDSGDTHLQT